MWLHSHNGSRISTRQGGHERGERKKGLHVTPSLEIFNDGIKMLSSILVDLSSNEKVTLTRGSPKLASSTFKAACCCQEGLSLSEFL